MFIRFNNSKQKYKCTFQNTGNDVKVTFIEEFEPNTSGFRLYSDTGKLLGDYSEHKVIKESFVDGFIFSEEEGEQEKIKESKTLGERLEETDKKIENLISKVDETMEALNCTNNAIEELLFNYILKETIEENE